MPELQAALNVIDAELRGRPELAVMAATARGLMRGYHARWESAEWVATSIEQEFQLPIVNPDSGRPSRTFTQAGKIDGLAAFGDRTFLVEHKTCNEDIATPDAPYWRRLEIDAQINAYLLAQWQTGVRIDGTLYDVIRKPLIRPKALTKAAAAELITGTYCGQPVNDFGVAGEVESPSLFEARLVADIASRPEWYFQRRTLYRTDSQVLEYARELWEVADEIRLARLNNRHSRNTGACMNWGRPCEYLGICSGHDSPDSDRWQNKAQVHEELSLACSGRDVLTHSRISCFRTCRRKHYYRYEIGIKRPDDEVESLFFGSLFHAALAAWWQHPLLPEVVSHEYAKRPATSAAAGQATEHR